MSESRSSMSNPIVNYGLGWLTKMGNSIDGPHTERVRITPEDASAILKHSEGVNFRKLSKDHVDRLAKMMVEDNWFDNGEPLQWNTDGFLINGQHRLHAVVVSGVSVEFDLRFNADDRGIDKIRPRTSGQNLCHAGSVNGRGVASVLRLVLARESGREKWPENIDCEDFQLEQRFLQDPDLAEAAASYCARKRLVLRGSVAGWLYYEATRAGLQPECEAFLESVESGVNVSKSDSAYWLRERLIGTRQAIGSKLNRMTIIELVILAWNKFITNTPCMSLRTEKKFPKLNLKSTT